MQDVWKLAAKFGRHHGCLVVGHIDVRGRFLCRDQCELIKEPLRQYLLALRPGRCAQQRFACGIDGRTLEAFDNDLDDAPDAGSVLRQVSALPGVPILGAVGNPADKVGLARARLSHYRHEQIAVRPERAFKHSDNLDLIHPPSAASRAQRPLLKLQGMVHRLEVARLQRRGIAGGRRPHGLVRPAHVVMHLSHRALPLETCEKVFPST